MSLIHKPELLILDEPTNGMDPAGIYEFRNLSSQGVTGFISSHLLHEIEQICDRVAGSQWKGHLAEDLGGARKR